MIEFQGTVFEGLSEAQRESLIPPFLEFLRNTEAVRPEDLAMAESFHAALDTRASRLCSLKGYIAIGDIPTVTAHSQSEDDFAARAAQQGLLTEDQVLEVLALQADRFRLLIECLLFTEVMSPSDLRVALECFRIRPMDEPVPSTRRRDPDDSDAPPPTLRGIRLTAARVREILRRIRQLSAMPAVAQRVLTLLRDPDVKVDTLAQLVEGDPGLSAQVMRIVNSALFAGDVSVIVSAKRKGVPSQLSRKAGTPCSYEHKSGS